LSLRWKIQKEAQKRWKNSIFHCFFQWEMSEKQMTFFTVNCAEKLESLNQCYLLHKHCEPLGQVSHFSIYPVWITCFWTNI
jgi:hypothetical protein